MSGFHVEAVAGYDASSIQGESDGGVLYGLGAGYDLHVGRRGPRHPGRGVRFHQRRLRRRHHQCRRQLLRAASRDLYIGGRAGAMVGRNLLLYAGVGYTNARFELDYDDGTPAGTGNFSLSDHLDGVRVGGGGEFGIGRNAFLRAEYRYSNYQESGDRSQFVGGFGFRF